MWVVDSAAGWTVVITSVNHGPWHAPGNAMCPHRSRWGHRAWRERCRSEAAVAGRHRPDGVVAGHGAGPLGVDHAARADVDAHVVGGRAEEHEVAGARAADGSRRRLLRGGRARDRDAGLAVDVG